MIKKYVLAIYCFIIHHRKLSSLKQHMYLIDSVGWEFGHNLTVSSASESLTRMQSEQQAELGVHLKAQLEKYSLLKSLTPGWQNFSASSTLGLRASVPSRTQFLCSRGLVSLPCGHLHRGKLLYQSQQGEESFFKLSSY